MARKRTNEATRSLGKSTRSWDEILDGPPPPRVLEISARARNVARRALAKTRPLAGSPPHKSAARHGVQDAEHARLLETLADSLVALGVTGDLRAAKLATVLKAVAVSVKDDDFVDTLYRESLPRLEAKYQWELVLAGSLPDDVPPWALRVPPPWPFPSRSEAAQVVLAAVEWCLKRGVPRLRGEHPWNLVSMVSSTLALWQPTIAPRFDEKAFVKKWLIAGSSG